MGKQKRLRIERRAAKSTDKQSLQPNQIDTPTEAQEQEHADWLARHGHAYISLAETVRTWKRSPEQILRWEYLSDQRLG